MRSGLIGFLIWIPVLVALWIGVIGLGKAERRGAWWAMLGGLSLVCLGLVLSILGGFLMMQQVSARMGSGGALAPPGIESGTFVMMGGAGAMGVGALLYSIGFALHGFQARRIRERITELEMVIEAQNEQLSRTGGESTT